MCMQRLWNSTDGENPSSTNAYLSTTNAAQKGLGMNTGLRDDRLTTNRLNHSTVSLFTLI